MSQELTQKFMNNLLGFTSVHHDTYPAIDSTKADLSGKHVLITGASKGIGRAIAISYAKAGASGIVLGARSPLQSVVKEVLDAAKQAGRSEPKVLALNLDVADRKSVEAAAKEVSEQLVNGRIDILINNAGYLSPFVKIPDQDPDEWWRDFEVNTKGVYLVTRSFLPHLLKSSHRVVLNVTSIGAHLLTPGASGYGLSKLAVIRFTEYLESDHGSGKDDIVAISVHPGGIKSDLAYGMPEELHQVLVDEPELPGDTFVWLGRERREWLSGRYMSVQWDVEELEAKKEEILKAELLKVRLAFD